MKRYDFIGALRCPKDSGALREAGESIRCLSCGLSWREAGGKIYFIEPPKDFVAGGEVDARSKAKWSHWRRENLSFFERYLGERGTEDVLIDIGAGAAPFRDVLSKFEHVIGVDFFPYKDVQVVVDITGVLPFKEHSCDIVFLSNVLEHIPTPSSLLTECFRILRPGGLLVGTVPFLREVHMEPYDFHRYTYLMLKRLLAQAGFRAHSVESLGNPFYVFEMMQQQFFNRLVDTRAYSSRFKQSMFRFTARLGRKIFTIATFLFHPIFSRAASSTQYTEGYGFAAWKLMPSPTLSDDDALGRRVSSAGGSATR